MALYKVAGTLVLGFQFLKTEGFLLKGRVRGRQLQVQKLLLYRARRKLVTSLAASLDSRIFLPEDRAPCSRGKHERTIQEQNTGLCLFSRKLGRSVVQYLWLRASQLSHHPSVPMAPPSSPSIPQYLWLLPGLPASFSTYGSS